MPHTLAYSSRMHHLAGRGPGLPCMVDLRSRQQLLGVFPTRRLAVGRAAVALGSSCKRGRRVAAPQEEVTMDRITRLWRQPLARTASIVALLLTLLTSGALVVSRATHAS